MANVNFRLELRPSEAQRLVEILVAGLANGQPQSRVGVNVVLFEDDTRAGQRNGHGLHIMVDGRFTNDLFTTAHDVVIDPA